MITSLLISLPKNPDEEPLSWGQDGLPSLQAAGCPFSMGQVGVHLPGRPEGSGFLGQAGSLSLITDAFCVVIIPSDVL